MEISAGKVQGRILWCHAQRLPIVRKRASKLTHAGTHNSGVSGNGVDALTIFPSSAFLQSLFQQVQCLSRIFRSKRKSSLDGLIRLGELWRSHFLLSPWKNERVSVTERDGRCGSQVHPTDPVVDSVLPNVVCFSRERHLSERR